MPGRPLILAPADDPHACALAWAIRRQGVEPVWTPSLRAGQSHYTFRIGAEHEAFQDALLSGDRVSAVWNRRVHDPVPDCAEEDRQFATWEWKLFQRNVFAVDGAYGDALWINGFAAAQRAEHKLVQLSACRRLGIPFPDTVVTTDACEVAALIRRWGQVVFKSFLVHQWEERDSGRLHAVGVVLLNGDSELPADAIAVCPGIYQQYIEKRCDVRVTVMGNRLFALRLGRGVDGAFVDWRGHSRDPEFRAEAMALPVAVEAKLRELMRELGLVFGCIDLVVDKDGQFHFLEVNQAGQFLFMEDMIPDLPVLQTMTALLVEGTVDASVDVLKPVTMKDFWSSDAYAALRERVARHRPERPLFTLE
ncbi:ATP-grasp domain-containing protein [Luteibacter sp. NPDC031894]|uniref:ATP-grasp domain-containing protein n=1 Tax=Luteibacter sp. NPDC031894 TaxID=3390572 RepID=UPI003D000325